MPEMLTTLTGLWRKSLQRSKLRLFSPRLRLSKMSTFKLQEKASQLGANAVIKVEYNRGTLQASGIAVVLEA